MRRSAFRAVAASTSSPPPSRAPTRRPGRDIYGERRVTRPILELRAEIEQGDSGGPLILADGTIGGVVFAEARTDEEVGYALTPSSVSDAIRALPGRYRAPSPTGGCIH